MLRSALVGTFLLLAAVPAFAQRTAAESRRHIDSMAAVDGLIRLDTHRLEIKVDGHPRTVKVVAYVTNGQIFIKGNWVSDPTARFGPEGILSACVLRVPARMGAHNIVVDTMTRFAAYTGEGIFDRSSDTTGTPFFSAMFSGVMKDGRAFAIYRSDWNGGAGNVTISSIDTEAIQGRFTLTAYNENDPHETREITGEFMLPFQRWTNDYYAGSR